MVFRGEVLAEQGHSGERHPARPEPVEHRGEAPRDPGGGDAVMPGGLDSVSMLPALLGRRAGQRQHDFLYWEFYEQGGRQAVRFGSWKAIRQPIFTGPIEIYDLASDAGEQHDRAASRPDLVKRAASLMARAHVPDPRWRPSGS